MLRIVNAEKKNSLYSWICCRDERVNEKMANRKKTGAVSKKSSNGRGRKCVTGADKLIAAVQVELTEVSYAYARLVHNLTQSKTDTAKAQVNLDN